MAAAHAHSAPAPSDRRPDGRAGSRRIFPPQFKLQVLEAYRRDAQCRGNQRATARKFGIHRRQIQKWLQAEPALRAALLRRAPQPAPSPPPYAAGSPESARLPSPPPAALPTLPLHAPTPLPLPVPAPSAEPIDLSVRRPSPPPACPPRSVPEPSRKPFKLFRPYLLEDEDRKPVVATSLPILSVGHVTDVDRKPVFATLPVSCVRHIKDEDRKPVIAALPAASGGHVSAFVPVAGAAGCALAACAAPRWCAPLPAYPAPLR